ncbi:Phosphoglucosamine mutase [Thermodesulfobium narugense DSM 14796]|uniref:Phosphoglucosamine mutase n=1 Tax=Thermodesulfobium narugense DSM 14796 TaxID=747365 RepID=M1E821_9BACT|nr:phosphoglucosamine mutase [Thermodesulfobium narugense]AEE14239.1 Phosphoglucosamine mutase [Thermodesulfobium narugense DSM 14796]
MNIKFGTDGWRAKIAQDYTFENLEKVSLALAITLEEENSLNKTCVIGYDTRFFSEDFANHVAEVLSGVGFDVIISDNFIPTPTLAFSVKDKSCAVGIMITASHNPYNYNGFKIKQSFGGSASKEFTSKVESNLEKIKTYKFRNEKGKIKVQNLFENYKNSILKFVDINAIKESGIKVAIDCMNGAGSGYLSSLLSDLNIKVFPVRNKRDPYFKGSRPEPIPQLLGPLSYEVFSNSLNLGTALDGDGDRVASCDASGTIFTSQQTYVLLLNHLVTSRKLKGKVLKNFAVSVLVDKLCKLYDIEFEILPVGFKYICSKMISEGNVLMGGEESGGFGFLGHIPDRDGFLSSLYLIESVVMSKKSLMEQLDEIYDKVGFFEYDRYDLKLETSVEEVRKKIRDLIENPAKKIGEKKVSEISTIDGIKYILEDESWLLIRPSGTEPLVRIYAEGKSIHEAKALIGFGRKLFQ